MRRRHAAAMAHRNAPLAPLFPKPANGTATTAFTKLPTGWKNQKVASNGEMRFRTDNAAAVPGQATLSVVALSRPNPTFLTFREQRSMLGGVSFSDLRRIVIDKMITEGGWVINDYQRQVDGSRVLVVTAQTPSDGRSPEKSWNFYFAEVNGRIYSLTINTPVQFSDRLTAEGERFIASLHGK
jgi:hypothetical protein